MGLRHPPPRLQCRATSKKIPHRCEYRQLLVGTSFGFRGPGSRVRVRVVSTHRSTVTARMAAMKEILGLAVGAAGLMFGVYQWWFRRATRLRVEPGFLGLIRGDQYCPAVRLTIVNESEHAVTVSNFGMVWKGMKGNYARHFEGVRNAGVPAVVAAKDALELFIPALTIPRAIDGKPVPFRVFISTKTLKRFQSRRLEVPQWMMEDGLEPKALGSSNTSTAA